MVSSGTYNFQLSNADVILEAFDRCEIRPASITSEHMVSARRSINLELQRWSNLGVNLWEVDLLTINLVQGVNVYSLPQDTVSLLDVYLRTFTLAGQYNFTSSFSTVSASQTVKVTISNHGLLTGQWVNLVTPVAVSNLLLQGYYQITYVDTNNFTIQSPVAATSTINNGGAVPLFTAVVGQPYITVTLANHGLVQGATFNVAAQTSVGGVTLSGGYQVTGVIDSSNFAIYATQVALFNDSQHENGNLAQMQFQAQGTSPQDNIISPYGRTDYAMVPDKLIQGRPTVYWMDRQITPKVYLYQTPDENGPYQLCMYRMRRCQDANATMGETPDIPYRFFDTFCARMAERLAFKYAKEMLPVLSAEAAKSWSEAQIEDRERADLMIMPDLSGYYKD